MNVLRILCSIAAVLMVSPAVAQPQPVAPAMTQVAAPGRVERHIADLKRRLAITPAEATQWDAFAAVMRENGKHMSQLYESRATHVTAMKANDDMRNYAELTRAHAEDMQRLIPVFDSLYAVMPADQQARADKIFQSFQNRRRPG